MILNRLLISLVRPYTWREMPGWGKVWTYLLPERVWRDIPPQTVRGKFHGYTMQLDLSNWSDQSTYLTGRWHHLEMLEYLRDKLRPGDTVVDIGANHGEFTLAASYLVGPRGKVISFEPNPSCAERVRNDLRRNGIKNVALHECGLADREDTLTLSVPKIASGEATFGKSGYAATDLIEVEAQIRRGDDVLAKETPKLIKIDVEGFECHVLRGLQETLRRSKPIVAMEVIDSHLNACGSSVAEVRQIMEGLGYKGHRLVLRGKTWALAPFANTETSDVIWTPETSSSRSTG